VWISAVLICDMPPDKPGTQMIHQWFNNFIMRFDSALQSEISQDNVERVFTVSPFHSPRYGYPSWIRITSIDSRLNQLLTEHLPELCNNHLELDNGQKIQVTQVHLPETLPPFLKNAANIDRFNPLTWIGHSNPTQLISTIMQMPLSYKLKLFFHTPTSLRTHSPSAYIKNNLLPLPQQIFETYIRRWQTLTSSVPIIALSEFLGEYTRLGQYSLRTYNVDGWRWGNVTGFTGYADYVFAGNRYLPTELARDRDHLIRTCYILASLAFFVGTGQLTSFGMGQTLPIFI
jgi:hypothetical protein